MVNNELKQSIASEIIFIINASGFSGGTGTLSIRISEYLISYGFQVIYLYTSDNDMNNRQALVSLGVKVVKYFNFNFHEYNSRPEIHYYTISYSFDRYLDINQRTQSFDNYRNLLYIVHPNTIVPKRRSLLTTFYVVFFQRFFEKLLENNLLLFMDGLCVNSFQELFTDLADNIPTVLLLPYRIDETIQLRRKLTKKISLLTIFRSSFPFKGYIFGLLKQFVVLNNIFPELKLRIITFGSQVNQLQEAISDLPEQAKQNIEYLGRVPYDGLAKWFIETDLYIGMGTTVLDAANHGIPALVVNSYTYESETFGYFSDNPTELAAMKGNTVHTDVFIREFIRKSPKEREALGKASYEALKAHYSDRAFFDRLFEIFQKSSSIELSLKERIGIKLILVYYKLRCTLKGFIK